MAHGKSRDRVSATATPQPSIRTNVRIETEPGYQMRDALSIARDIMSRRSDIDSSINNTRSTAWQNHLDRVARMATEDLRHEDPSHSYQTYRREDGRQANVVGRQIHTPEMQRQRMPDRLRLEFADSKGVLVCQRRSTRRSVLFSLRKIGKGSGGRKKARWTDKSYIVCKKRG